MEKALLAFRVSCMLAVFVGALKDYTAQRREGKNPVFRTAETNIGDGEVWNEAHARKWEN